MLEEYAEMVMGEVKVIKGGGTPEVTFRESSRLKGSRHQQGTKVMPDPAHDTRVPQLLCECLNIGVSLVCKCPISHSMVAK
jgi:hypothetical protein